ncbi:phage terminase large subunit family protein [Azospirillum brasilense]|uniref:phage terminase large subunit family protein n=1 Tax=Azospirillum brasilense TaxID=192 RepID=UPI000E6951CA|nr:terminase gpA endonuclease subunit [Azospirillum brasilense]NUB29457.1 terminase [Azospirillum brasilense]NUB34133.1 terminase [Azospirillum brasilense]RIW00980.1 terminase [Azospirillum brasilense]
MTSLTTSEVIAVRGGSVLAGHVARWLAALKPKQRQSLSEWSAKNARLEDGSRYVAFPFQIGIQDAFTEPEVKQITALKASRIGYSQIVKNFIAYCADQAPSRVLVYQPTIDDAEDFGKDDVAKLITWPAVRRLFSTKTRDSNNTIRSKRFPGGWIKIKGANSPKEFRRITADKVILEEVDGYPKTAGDEGDQVGLAFKRCTTSDEPLKAAGSTPTVKGVSKIEALFLQGTQEHRYVPCPCCGEMQILVFGNGTGPGIRWEPKEAPTRAWYVCVNGCVIEEDAKAGMDERGEWRAHAPQNWPHRSFHIWAAYSQFEGASWLEIAREFVTVRKDPNKLRVFVNQVLAETYEVRGEAPAWRQLYAGREDYQGVPAGGLVLTGGIDVQKDRVELFVWAWGADWQCWLVDHIVIHGNPYEATVWDEVSQAILGRWRHASGVDLALSKVGADTGFATTQVEAWSRKHPGLVIPVKGATSLGAPSFAWSSVREAAPNGKRRKRGLRLGMIGGHALTLELYGKLSLQPPTDEERADGAGHPAGFIHLSKLATEEVCKQLVGDQWMEDRGEWKQVHATEALDGWKYARACTIAMGMERWTAARWAGLADEFPKPRLSTVETGAAAPAPTAPAQPAAIPGPTVKRRRIPMPKATYADDPSL